METEKFQELVLQKLDTLAAGQERLETRMDVLETRLNKLETRLDNLERTVNMIKDETAGLMEFQTEARESLKQLGNVVETQSVMSDILGKHEIEIRKLQKRLA